MTEMKDAIEEAWLESEKSWEELDREDEERERAVSAGEVKWGRWSYEPSVFVLNHVDDLGVRYQVDLLRLQNPVDLHQITWHLAEKAVFDDADIGCFVRAIGELSVSFARGEGPPLFHILPAAELLFPLPPPIAHEDIDGRPGVYAIRAGRALKIGRASDILARLRALQTANHEPLEVLAVLSDRPSREKRFHAKFAHLRIKGRAEWFHLGEQIAVHIRDIRDREGTW